MTSNLRKIVSIVCAVFLLASFGMHSVQVKHMHYGESHHVHAEGSGHTHSDSGSTNTDDGSESLSDKMHMAEKKFVVFLLAASLLFVAFFIPQDVSYRRVLAYTRTRFKAYTKRTINSLLLYIRLFYSSGILNPKLF